jgi:hypothetical protein
MAKAKKARKAALALGFEATREIEDLTAVLLVFYANARYVQDGKDKSFYLGRCIARRVAELNSAIMDVVAGGPENVDADAMAKVVYG